MVRAKVLGAGFSKFAPSSAVLFTTLAMVSSSNATPSLSYAERAKLGKVPASSQSPSPSSTSMNDVEKPGEDVCHGGSLNGLNPAHNATPNFWAVRKEQMAAKAAPAAASSSSSPILAASPSLPVSNNLRGTRAVNGVDLNDASSWPQVAAASAPIKDKSDKSLSKDTTTLTPTPTPKKSQLNLFYLFIHIDLSTQVKKRNGYLFPRPSYRQLRTLSREDVLLPNTHRQRPQRTPRQRYPLAAAGFPTRMLTTIDGAHLLI